MLLTLAAVAIFTPFIESAASVIGAGIVIGGFAGASNGVARRSSRKQVEGTALRDSYAGATWALAFWVFDRCIVYAT